LDKSINFVVETQYISTHNKLTTNDHEKQA